MSDQKPIDQHPFGLWQAPATEPVTERDVMRSNLWHLVYRDVLWAQPQPLTCPQTASQMAIEAANAALQNYDAAVFNIQPQKGLNRGH